MKNTMGLQKIVLFFFLLLSGCFFDSNSKFAIFIKDTGSFFDSDTYKQLGQIITLVKNKTGVHILLITQTENTPNPSGAHDSLKHYKKENPDLPGIVSIVWHHAHSRLDIVLSDSLKKIQPNIEEISQTFYSRVNTMGVANSLKYVLMTISSFVCQEFNVDFKTLLQEHYPEYDNLNTPVRTFRKKVKK